MNLRVEHHGECRTYAMLRHVACHLLDVAKTHETGSLLQLQACAVFHAFTFEAYLNHVGAEEIAFWEEIERIPYRNKLSALAKHLGIAIDYGRRPFQTIRELFDLRDRLAHGRTLDIHEVYETSKEPSHDSAWYLFAWEKLTVADVERFAEDVDAGIETINSARRSPDPMLWNQGMRGRVVGPAR